MWLLLVLVLLAFDAAILFSAWRLAKKINNDWGQAAVKALAVTIVFCPGLLGGHGVMIVPASIAVFFGWINLLPLAVGFFMSFAVILAFFSEESPSKQA